MSDDKFTAIIVGAGPAGSTAAYLLAKEGHDVLLIEYLIQKNRRGLLDARASSGEPAGFFGFSDRIVSIRIRILPARNPLHPENAPILHEPDAQDRRVHPDLPSVSPSP